MSSDLQHKRISYSNRGIQHLYGDKIRILADPYLISILAKLCNEITVQPFINTYVEILYRALLKEVINEVFPRKQIKLSTRMSQYHSKEAFYEGEAIDENTKVVSVNLARAGTFPSHICYSELNYLIRPEQVRQDHFICNRKVDDKGHVIGVDISGSKIGGPVDKSILLFPDPMGATGGTICEAVDEYKRTVGGVPLKIVSMHLIITPEYIKKIKSAHPDIDVFAIRLDRGLSSEDVLKSVPGTYLDLEKGLNDTQYIVPGGGGLGEILNNSFV